MKKQRAKKAKDKMKLPNKKNEPGIWAVKSHKSKHKWPVTSWEGRACPLLMRERQTKTATRNCSAFIVLLKMKRPADAKHWGGCGAAALFCAARGVCICTPTWPLSHTLKVCTIPSAAMLLPHSFLVYIYAPGHWFWNLRFPLMVAELIQWVMTAV